MFTVHVTWTAAETQEETGRGGQRRLHNMITGNALLPSPNHFLHLPSSLLLSVSLLRNTLYYEVIKPSRDQFWMKARRGSNMTGLVLELSITLIRFWKDNFQTVGDVILHLKSV